MVYDAIPYLKINDIYVYFIFKYLLMVYVVAIVNWQRNSNSNSSLRIDQLKQDLIVSKGRGADIDKTEILALEKELLEAYQSEERFWKEKAWVKWLKWGGPKHQVFPLEAPS